MKKTFDAAACVAVALGLFCACAQASSEFIKLGTRVLQEREVVSADGKLVRERVPAQFIEPGSELIYEVGYANTGSEATQIVITNPLPSDLVYESYGARAVRALMAVSVDDGRSFGSLASRRIRESDGALRPANAEDITHVRWTTQRPVKPGERGAVSLRVRLR